MDRLEKNTKSLMTCGGVDIKTPILLVVDNASSHFIEIPVVVPGVKIF
jgi:hypothetical protein